MLGLLMEDQSKMQESSSKDPRETPLDELAVYSRVRPVYMVQLSYTEGK